MAKWRSENVSGACLWEKNELGIDLYLKEIPQLDTMLGQVRKFRLEGDFAYFHPAGGRRFVTACAI